MNGSALPYMCAVNFSHAETNTGELSMDSAVDDSSCLKMRCKAVYCYTSCSLHALVVRMLHGFGLSSEVIPLKYKVRVTNIFHHALSLNCLSWKLSSFIG